MIKKTVEKLGLDWNDVVFDDRETGGDAYYTARKAFLSALESGAEHAIILQDDIEVCNNFREIASEIIETHPDKIIALFPCDKWVDGRLAYRRELVGKTPYVRNNWYTTGCGFILPIKYIPKLLEHWDYECKSNPKFTEDSSLFKWALLNRIMILNTVPALVQHLGNESLVSGARAKIRITKHYKENPIANWKSKTIIK